MPAEARAGQAQAFAQIAPSAADVLVASESSQVMFTLPAR